MNSLCRGPWLHPLDGADRRAVTTANVTCVSSGRDRYGSTRLLAADVERRSVQPVHPQPDDHSALGDQLFQERFLVLRLRGGAKKRKKKVYSTPKKIKHKRKKTKLAVLKYYKVDGDGKIERLRRECPTKECGAGVFMAAMHNRQYCGKCHLTYVFDESK